MQHREIIKSAWHLTRHTPGLLWYGAVPAFFSTIVGISYIFYQFWAFRSSPFFGGVQLDYEKLIGHLVNFIGQYEWVAILGLIFGIVSVIGFFLVPPLCEGGIIGVVAAIQRGKDANGGDGFSIGLANFFSMFEYRLLASTFSFAEFFTIFSLVVRHLGINSAFFIIFAVIFVISLITYFLFLYTENFIILERKPIISSMLASAKLVLSNLRHTFLMWVLMLLIAIRVVINILLLFLIPTLVVIVSEFFISQAAIFVGVIVGSLVGLAVLLLAAYLGGMLHVFTTTAWTLAFLTLDHDRADNLLKKD